MKYILMTILIALLGSSYIHAATPTEDALLNNTDYTLAGTFGPHDFPPLNDNDPFDWAFTTASGEVFQLKGTALTADNPFGWKRVNVTPPTPTWYMFQLHEDVDGDGSLRYDWVLLSANMQHKSAYKLTGVTATGNFAYSQPLSIDYTLNGTSIKTGSIGTFENPKKPEIQNNNIEGTYTVVVTPTTANTLNGTVPCKGARGIFAITASNGVVGSITDRWGNLFNVTGSVNPTTGIVTGGFASAVANVATYEGVIRNGTGNGTWVDTFGCEGVWQGSKQ